jgi:predicted O-methyltransferase YrrM
MQTIEISNGARIGLEDIFKGIRQLDNQALATFAVEVNRLVSQRKAQTPAAQEAALLRKIKSAIPASIWHRQRQLYSKLQEGVITAPEHEELVLLNGIIEEKNAERILLIGELATLRGISARELALQLKPKNRHA